MKDLPLPVEGPYIGGLTSSFASKVRGLCLMSLNWCRFLHVHVLFETNGDSFLFVLFNFVEHFCMRDEFWVEMYHETRRLVLKIWDEWYNKWMITQGARTPCFLGILTPVFLSYLKTNFRLKCLQPVWLAFHFSRNVTILQFLFFLIETDDRN